MDRCVRKAYAKINLGLDVIGRMENGYHEVRMIMQTVGIADVLTLEKRPAGITVTTDSKELKADESNLIYKAARLMLDRYEIKEGVHVHLEKHIPIAAGMAGGSTDAAATMLGMNELFALGESEEALRELGVTIGADVPYCIMGGTALAEGIGEILTKLPPVPRVHLAVAKPEINVSTKFVYEHIDRMGIAQHPDIDGMLEAIRRQDIGGIAQRLGNVLETVTAQQYPVIGEIKAVFAENGSLGSLMSGSGPTVFGLFRTAEEAQRAIEAVGERGLAGQLFVTGFIGGEIHGK